MPGVIQPPNPEVEQGDFPPFPLDALPPILCDITKAISDVNNADPDLAGPMVLATASACLGRGLLVKGKPGKATAPNLFVMVAKRSGSGGSSAFDDAYKPLVEFEAAEMKVYDTETRPRLNRKMATLASDIARKIGARKKAQEDNDHHLVGRLEDELDDLQVQLEATELQLIPPYYVRRDAKQERLAGIMEMRGGVMAQFDPDAGNTIKDILGIRYGNGQNTNENLHLSGYTGERVSIDRQGSGKGNHTEVKIEKPCLTCLFVMTPDLMREMIGSGRMKEGGFLPRCLFYESKARFTGWPKSVKEIPVEVSSNYRRAAFALLNNYRNKALGELPPIDMEPGAFDLFYEHSHTTAENQSDDNSVFEARHTENAVRIALVLHAWNCVTLSEPAEVFAHERPLSEQTARNALRLWEWFTLHQTVLLAPHREAARASKLERIKALCPKKDYEISARDLVSARVASDAKEATQLLEQWVIEKECVKEEAEPTGKGGKPRSPRYRFPRSGRV